jgi:hypothetical protein
LFQLHPSTKASEKKGRCSSTRTDGCRQYARKEQEFENIFSAIENPAAVREPRNQISSQERFESIPGSNA